MDCKKNKVKKQKKGKGTATKSRNQSESSSISPKNAERKQQEKDAKDFLLDLQDEQDIMLDPDFANPYAKLYINKTADIVPINNKIRPQTAIDRRQDVTNKINQRKTRKSAVDDKVQTLNSEKNNQVQKSNKYKKLLIDEEEFVPQDEITSNRFMDSNYNKKYADNERDITGIDVELASFFPFEKKTPRKIEIDTETVDESHKRNFKVRPKTAVATFKHMINFKNEKLNQENLVQTPTVPKDYNDLHKKNIQMMNRKYVQLKPTQNIYGFEPTKKNMQIETEKNMKIETEKRLSENSIDGTNHQKLINNYAKQKGYTMSECFKENVYSDEHMADNKNTSKYTVNLTNILKDINETNANLVENNKNYHELKKSNSQANESIPNNIIQQCNTAHLIPNPNNNSKICSINNEILSKFTNLGKFNSKIVENQKEDESEKGQHINHKNSKFSPKDAHQNFVPTNVKTKPKRANLSHSNYDMSIQETNYNSIIETKNGERVNFL